MSLSVWGKTGIPVTRQNSAGESFPNLFLFEMQKCGWIFFPPVYFSVQKRINILAIKTKSQPFLLDL